MRGQQQYFRVPPSDVEVGEGSTAVIPCEVGNRHGRVQWTKDGLTLGKLNDLCMQFREKKSHFSIYTYYSMHVYSE